MYVNKENGFLKFPRGKSPRGKSSRWGPIQFWSIYSFGV